MPNIRVHRRSAPENVLTGDWTINTGSFACGNTVQNFDLSSATMGSGRWVLVRASNITFYAGATVTPPSGRTVVGVSREYVNYSGVTYDCIVVTLA